jgi:CBS domain-containing protein
LPFSGFGARVGFWDMRVSSAMSKHVDYVSVDATVRDVFRLIFGRGINGVPVCEGKNVIGFITGRDILGKLYPSMQEYMEDPVHSSDFRGMEKKIAEIFALTVDKIMNKNPKVVTSDTSLLKAQSIMFAEKVGILPVVDKKGILIGVISKGDIFKNVVGQSIPLQEEEGFYDWLAKRYDGLIDWKKRLSQEIPDLASLFTKEKVKKVLDVASSTGEHSIALVKKGFELFGIESSSLMDNIAQAKKHKLSKDNQANLHLLKGDYSEILKKLKDHFDAATHSRNLS